MAKYLAHSSGVLTEVQPITTSAGAADASKIPQTDSAGRLDTSLMPVGIAADTAAITASEALSAGDFVNVWNSAGNFRARKADASAAGKRAHGFVLAAVSNAAVATVYFEGTNTQLSSLTAGDYYLSATTPGAATATAPSGSGQVSQNLGCATSATALNFEPGMPITLV